MERSVIDILAFCLNYIYFLLVILGLFFGFYSVAAHSS